MPAFLTALLVLCALGVVGFAILEATIPSAGFLKRLLMAPATGIAALIVPLTTINEFGIPQRVGAVPLLAAMLLSSLAFVVIKRSRRGLGSLALVAVAVVLAAIIAGQGIILYGFDWVGASNEDALTYSTSALAFMKFGLFHLPQVSDVAARVDGSQAFWALYQIVGERPGTNELTAALSVALSRSPFQMFPLLAFVAFLAMVMAAAAMLDERFMRLRFVLPLLFLNAACALAEYSLLFELAPQIVALAISCCIVGVVQTIDARGGGRGFRSWLLVGALFGGLVVTYTEVSPFVAVAVVLSRAWHLRRDAVTVKRSLLQFGIALAAFAACTNAYLISVYQKYAIGSTSQLLRSTRAVDRDFVTQFPYFLKPAGLPALWGLTSFQASHVSHAMLLLCILAGALLTALAVVTCLVLSARGYVPAIVVVVMLLVALGFFSIGGAFQLFKLAMYVQPFLLCAIASAIVRVANRISDLAPFAGPVRAPARLLLPAAAVFAIVLLESPGAVRYIDSSAERNGAETYEQLWHASRSHLLSRLAAGSPLLEGAYTTLDGYNRQAVQYALGMKPDGPTEEPAFESPDRPDAGALTSPRYEAMYARSREIAEAEATTRASEQFAFDPERSHVGLFYLSFLARERDVERLPGALVDLSSVYGLLRQPERADPKTGFGRERRAAGSRLMLVPTDIGTLEDEVGDADRQASVYALETDPFFPNPPMAAIGPYLLFEVANPPKSVRLRFSLTESLNPNGMNALPAIHYVGSSTGAFNAVGRGSARLFSDPFAPLVIDGRAYVGLAFDSTPFSLGEPDAGAGRLYGARVRTPSKLIVAFARNISLANEGAPSAPIVLARFPTDLQAPSLEYSGISEEGWIAEHCYAVLRATRAHPFLKVSALVPRFPDTLRTRAIVSVDHRPVFDDVTSPGELTVRGRDRLPPGDHRVDIYFDETHPLGPADPRRAAARLSFLGFQ